jgi:hypothetical protein
VRTEVTGVEERTDHVRRGSGGNCCEVEGVITLLGHMHDVLCTRMSVDVDDRPNLAIIRLGWS